MRRQTAKIAIKIIDKIRVMIGERKLTQQDLADKMDVSQQAIYKLINKNKDISINKMEKIADALGVTFNELLPYSINQNNHDGSKENNQNISINDVSKILEKIVENQNNQMELMIKLIESLNKR